MRIIAALLALALLAGPAFAQQPQDFAAPDAELWRQMKEAFTGISMPLPAHQQLLQIIANVEREAQTRAVQARTAAERKAVAPKP